MPKERYSDADLRALKRAVEGLQGVIDRDLGHAHLLVGQRDLMTEDARRELAIREAERNAMFTSVPSDVQFANVRRWNAERSWGFTREEMARASKDMPLEQPPTEPGRLQQRASLLEAYLPDGSDGMPGPIRTFRELWGISVREHGARPCELFDLAPGVRLELRPGYVHRPGLRWRTIDLFHGWSQAGPACACGRSPFRLPPEAERPHAGLLAAAAHFPLWPARMDGRRVPYAWLAGYVLRGVPHRIGANGIKELVFHPRFVRDSDGRLSLYYEWDHVPLETHAVPVYADDKTDP